MLIKKNDMKTSAENELCMHIQKLFNCELMRRMND